MTVSHFSQASSYFENNLRMFCSVLFFWGWILFAIFWRKNSFYKRSMIFVTVSLLSLGNNSLCKYWRTCDNFLSLCEIWRSNAVWTSLVISEFLLPTVSLISFLAATEVKRHASLQHSAPTAKLIGIRVDTAADNKCSSTSQKLLLESTSVTAYCTQYLNSKSFSSIGSKLFQQVLESNGKTSFFSHSTQYTFVNTYHVLWTPKNSNYFHIFITRGHKNCDSDHEEQFL